MLQRRGAHVHAHGFNVIDSLLFPIYVFFFFSLGQSESTSRIQYDTYVHDEAISPNRIRFPFLLLSCLVLPFLSVY